MGQSQQPDHAPEDLALTEGIEPRVEGTAVGVAREQLIPVHADGGDGTVDLRWSLASGAFQVLLPEEEEAVITVGEAPSNPASERLHSLVRTRYARTTTFVAVLHPCARPGELTATVHRGAHDSVALEDSFALEVMVGGRTDRWRLAAADPGRGRALTPLS